jgi:GntR family transcriptional regulator
MRLWLSKNSEVALREQLATQIILGIISEDLKPDQRLPSRRELARRFRIHPNTVSAAYRDLAKRGWVEARRGSGIYVRDQAGAAAAGEAIELDRLVSTLFQIARQKGYSVAEIRSRVERWLSMQPPDYFLVVERDRQLRDILVAEIEEATGLPANGAAPGKYPDRAPLEGAAVVRLQGKAQEAESAIGREATCLMLRMRSIQSQLKTESRLTPDKLVTVVSGWAEFLKWARTVLVAAGVEPAAISLCDRSAPGWQKGLRSSELVITDALTARLLPAGCRARVFRIIADSSLDELRRLNESSQTSVTV